VNPVATDEGSVVTSWLGRGLWRLMKRSGHLSEVAGVQVLDLGREPRQEALEALDGAIKLLEHYSPRFLARLSRECPRYVLFDDSFPEYWSLVGAIVLGKEQLAASNNGQIALALVHEGTHARLERLGVSAKRHGLDRIEEICLNRERALAATFPNSEQWRSYVESKASTRWWSAERSGQRVAGRLAGTEASRTRRVLARLVARWATRNHPTQGRAR
jgi:hypothetical protein